MGYWLLKTEPSTYSYEDLEKAKKAVWDGVANPVAQRHMREMKPGDLAVVYHTGSVKAAVGVAKIVSAAYGEPPVFDLVPERRLAKPVTLAEIKASKVFADSPLVRMGRLSVVPLTAPQWKLLGG